MGLNCNPWQNVISHTQSHVTRAPPCGPVAQWIRRNPDLLSGNYSNGRILGSNPFQIPSIGRTSDLCGTWPGSSPKVGYIGFTFCPICRVDPLASREQEVPFLPHTLTSEVMHSSRCDSTCPEAFPNGLRLV